MIDKHHSEHNRSNSRERLTTKLLAGIGGQTGILLAGIITQGLIARGLGPDGKGMFSLALLVAGTIATLTHLSLGSANAHYIGRYPDERKGLVGNSILVAILWGGLVTASMYLYLPMIRDSFFPILNDRLLAMSIIAIVPLLIFEYANGLIMGFDRIRRLNFALSMREFIILGGVSFLWFYNLLFLDSVMIIWLASITFMALIQIITSGYFSSGILINTKLLYKTLPFGLKNHAANTFSFLKVRFDLFLIAYFLSPADVGYYSVAITLVTVLRYLPNAISQILVPYVSSHNESEGNIMTPLLTRLGFSTALLGGIVLGLFGWYIISLIFGNRFLPATPALLLLIPGAIVYTLATMLSGDLLGRGMPQYGVVVSTSAFFVNIVADIFLIPKFGIIGAAAASSVTHLLAGIMFLYFFIQVSKANVRDVLFIRKDDLIKIFRSSRSIID